MQYPDAYIAYLIEFQDSRDLFECHELLEEYWKENPHDPNTALWLGLIQLAVGLYHQRRGNNIGAQKMLLQAERRLGAGHLQEIGLDQAHLLAELSQRRRSLEGGVLQDYTDMNLRITDQQLLSSCQEQCVSRGLVWEGPSRMDNEQLIHRHKLRDRSEVIAARLASYTAKRERERAD